ncbi:type I-E CRISPR-associated protein Cse2/CasB [Nonomuraea sp. NPDC005983]|uniref:type I-E CRISPR-associated protein Cse2/CasB n=1 Tax=Nonomuraea sp. NPDC005983 TaxID=3155595 RepID=UPI0033B32D22
MTTVPPAAQRSVVDLVGDVAGEYISRLQAGYLLDESWAVSTLAQLRRGAGKLPQDVPELWGMTGTEQLQFERELSDGEVERAEAALFLAVTLYALHQQSRPEQRMHRRGDELGEAVRRLMSGGAIDEPIRRRFVRVGTAGTRQALANRLREVITLLRGQSIPLDYALLARQLYQAQHPEGMRQVRQRWGRSFHAYRPDNSGGETRTDTDASAERDAS